ncbi:hypothetical protein L7F22_032755 [Adiantum nelumboides]|nr:hypothetical protein [Adiantum nelumboides]
MAPTTTTPLEGVSKRGVSTENKSGPGVEKGTSGPTGTFAGDELGSKEGVDDADDVRIVILPPGLLDGKALPEAELSREAEGSGGHGGGGYGELLCAVGGGPEKLKLEDAGGVYGMEEDDKAMGEDDDAEEDDCVPTPDDEAEEARESIRKFAPVFSMSLLRSTHVAEVLRETSKTLSNQTELHLRRAEIISTTMSFLRSKISAEIISTV